MGEKIIYQFAFRNGKPAIGCEIVDCRIIPNPYHKGKPESEIVLAVQRHACFKGLVAKAVNALRSSDVVAIGCQFGRHRSGIVATEVARQTGARIIKGD